MHPNVPVGPPRDKRTEKGTRHFFVSNSACASRIPNTRAAKSQRRALRYAWLRRKAISRPCQNYNNHALATTCRLKLSRVRVCAFPNMKTAPSENWTRCALGFDGARAWRPLNSAHRLDACGQTREFSRHRVPMHDAHANATMELRLGVGERALRRLLVAIGDGKLDTFHKAAQPAHARSIDHGAARVATDPLLCGGVLGHGLDLCMHGTAEGRGYSPGPGRRQAPCGRGTRTRKASRSTPRVRE